MSDETKKRLYYAEDESNQANERVRQLEWAASNADTLLRAIKGLGVFFDAADDIERIANLELITVQAVRRTHELLSGARGAAAALEERLEQAKHDHERVIAAVTPVAAVAPAASEDTKPLS